MKRKFLLGLALVAGMSTSAFAQVEGKITFDGKAPERKPLPGITSDPNCSKGHKGPVLDESVIVGKGGELANAVVYLKGDLKGEVPADPVVLDQVNCIYTPHVVSVTVGQQLIATNSDPFLHNVHSLPEISPPVNKAQPVKGQKDTVPVKGAEQFKIKCDVHPWMSAWVASFDHPFHGVTGEDGVFFFETKGLKDGEYEVGVWHEKFKECASGKVTVKGGKGTVDLKVTPKAAAVPAAEKEVLVSAAANGPTCCTDGSKCAVTAAKAAEVVKAAKQN